MKNKKTIVIVLIIVAVIVIGVIAFLLVRRRNKKKQEELEAQLAALQAAQNNPGLPPIQKANIAQQIAALLAQIGTKANTDEDTTPIILNWNGGGVGICVNAATLDKSKKLKKGITSPEVCQLQYMLNKKGAKLIVDGGFGTKTETALLANTQVKEITLESVPKKYYA